MRVTVDLRGLKLKNLDKLEALIADPTPLYKKLGALMAGESHRAFKAQKFGEDQWHVRYPGQDEPKFNIAGAIMDWKSGRPNPKPNRFQDRPALIDEGMRGGLQASITFAADKDGVVVGTNKPYARVHQEGGGTAIPYGESTRQLMRDWLWKKGKQPIKGKMVIRERKKGYLTEEKSSPYKAGREPYAKHVLPLLHKSLWTQRIIRRPFIGIHDQLEGDILKMVAEHIQRLGR